MGAVDYGAPVERPALEEIYRWFSGNLTDLTSVWAAPLRIAINEIDFRGALSFLYYHQVVGSIAVENSTEVGMYNPDGTAEFAGGSPYGGYPIYILGSGFDGYDGNASTVRVRFETQLQSTDVADDNTTNATNATALLNATDGLAQLSNASSSNVTVLNGTAAAIEVYGNSIVELTPEYILISAPFVRLDEGEIITERGYPCWNPPCRRTVVTVAINGVDFVGRAEPLNFYFFDEPRRFFNMMEQELLLLVFVLFAMSLINALLTWQWRFECYDRYLKQKYRLKNRTLRITG